MTYNGQFCHQSGSDWLKMDNFGHFSTFPRFSPKKQLRLTQNGLFHLICNFSNLFPPKQLNFGKISKFFIEGGGYIELWSCQICHKQGSCRAYGTAFYVEVQSFIEIPLYHSVFYFCHTLAEKDSSGGLLVVFWQFSGHHQKTARRWSSGGFLVVLWQSFSNLLVTNRRLPEDHQKTAKRPLENCQKTTRRLPEDHKKITQKTMNN